MDVESAIFELLGAKVASFVGLTEVLFAVGFAWLLLGQLPSAVQFLGGAFILGGVTLVRIDELEASPAAGRPARGRTSSRCPASGS